MELEPYNENWPQMFKEEAQYLLDILPKSLVLEFHHIGSTAIPEMPAKPIIDIGVMISSFEEAKAQAVDILKNESYEYLWRDDEDSPFMTFIKYEGQSPTHYIHMAEEEHPFWNRLYFREYLIKNKEEAQNYFDLKVALVNQFGDDKEGYIKGKSEYVDRITKLALKEIEEF